MIIFNQEFINKTQNILQTKCIGSNALFKKDLAKELGFNIEDSKNLNLGLNLISAMFDLGYFNDYKIIPGKYGGIVHESTFYREIIIQIFPDGFLQLLFETLNKLCSSIPVSRNKIAKSMNFSIEESEICNLISVALNKKYIIGFAGKVGKNGGIIKQDNVEPKININPTSKKPFTKSITDISKDNSITVLT